MPALLASPEPASRPTRQRRAQQRLTEDRARQLIAEYLAGANMRQVAERWGVHRTTVATQLRRAGVNPRPSGLGNQDVDEATQLYADGWSLARLGKRYECSADTVRSALLKAGLVMRRPWERS